MITQKRLKELLDYNPNTGIFTWKVDRGKRKVVKMGDIAGHINNRGYCSIRIDGKHHLAHRLAWLYIYGKHPKHEIDHQNHKVGDNRICNLREATRTENCRNASIRINNTSGISGVYWRRDTKKWVAQININGRPKNLGCFDSVNLAKDTREIAKIKYGYHPNHA